MNKKKIFISVGRTWSADKEQFVSEVENFLRKEGFDPVTVGRSNQPHKAPLQAIRDLLKSCSGLVVIAFERVFIADGHECKKDDDGAFRTEPIKDCKITTPWNHIEAAMAFSYEMPVLVICEKGVKAEGVVENTNEWYVQRVELKSDYLASDNFRSIFTHWKNDVSSYVGSRNIISKIHNQPLLSFLKDLKGKEWLQLLGATAAIFTMGMAFSRFADKLLSGF